MSMLICSLRYFVIAIAIFPIQVSLGQASLSPVSPSQSQSQTSQRSPAPTSLGLLLPRLSIGPRELSAAGVNSSEAHAAFVAISEAAPRLVAKLRIADQAPLRRESARKQAALRVRAGHGNAGDCRVVRETSPVAVAERVHRDAVITEALATFLDAIPAPRRAAVAAVIPRSQATAALSEQATIAPAGQNAPGQSQAQLRTGSGIAPSVPAAPAPDPAVTSAWRIAIRQAP